MDDVANAQPRRRAERLDVKLSRQAVRAVKPTRSRLQGWQARAAYLRAMAEHRRSAGLPLDAILAEAEAINTEIAQHQAMLDACGAELPESVRLHSDFQDVVRALGTAARAARSVAEGGGTAPLNYCSMPTSR